MKYFLWIRLKSGILDTPEITKEEYERLRTKERNKKDIAGQRTKYKTAWFTSYHHPNRRSMQGEWTRVETPSGEDFCSNRDTWASWKIVVQRPVTTEQKENARYDKNNPLEHPDTYDNSLS